MKRERVFTQFGAIFEEAQAEKVPGWEAASPAE